MIYFDNASTTRCLDFHLNTAQKYWEEDYYNPSSVYHSGIAINNLINLKRKEILSILKGGDNTLIFTSGGTESDNMAIFGTKKTKNSEIVISSAEHAAVYQPAKKLESMGYTVVICPVKENGTVEPEVLKSCLTKNTSLVSIIHVNNETGGINDIKSLVMTTKQFNPNIIFHSDGVQAVGKIPLNLLDLNVDLYSFGGHKIHAPKGIGGLYIKKNIFLNPLIVGGGQENNLRSSTENVASIVMLTDSIKFMYENLDNFRKNNLFIKDYLIKKLSEAEGLRFVYDNTVNNILLCISSKVRGEVLQHSLEKYNMLVGTGSACASNKQSDRIALSLGLSGAERKGMLRLSFGHYNNIKEATIFADTFLDIYEELKKYSN